MEAKGNASDSAKPKLTYVETAGPTAPALDTPKDESTNSNEKKSEDGEASLANFIVRQQSIIYSGKCAD
jgi:hypothetical protein